MPKKTWGVPPREGEGLKKYNMKLFLLLSCFFEQYELLIGSKPYKIFFMQTALTGQSPEN